MGNRFSRTIATAVRSAMGQVWMGPSGVERQSNVAMREAISPPTGSIRGTSTQFSTPRRE
jgi:hypothetical protein